MFVIRQLKGFKLSHIILKYVNILPAKFDFKKVKQNKVREVFSPENLGEIFKMDILAHFDLNFLINQTVYFTSMLLMVFNISRYSILQLLKKCFFCEYRQVLHMSRQQCSD